jgi:hypothetical protein
MNWDYCKQKKCKNFNGVRCKFPDSEYGKIDPSECSAIDKRSRISITPNDNKQFRYGPYPKGD